jgi:hypothetical protein
MGGLEQLEGEMRRLLKKITIYLCIHTIWCRYKC